ncbi:competence protein ComEC [Pseudodesulfovibrio sp. zrk46]|uniref:competence protein ComEC n=1 Tax=Pseudodesulfovibrio sp. zrk46 TaxID=2725288 RepID=UPI001448FE82|nr:competence protein ComEC [Pseudodesulfovibrio sp. zrk46]QJB56081.1 competence protein ComEC [Pseudodesulfovibrio sp. zrk46]
MSSTWITDPVFWVIALPALASSGILIQMVLSTFSCCGTFKLRGKPVLLKWWMIPTAAVTCGTLWAIAVAYVVFQ